MKQYVFNAGSQIPCCFQDVPWQSINWRSWGWHTMPCWHVWKALISKKIWTSGCTAWDCWSAWNAERLGTELGMIWQVLIERLATVQHTFPKKKSRRNKELHRRPRLSQPFFLGKWRQMVELDWPVQNGMSKAFFYHVLDPCDYDTSWLIPICILVVFLFAGKKIPEI